MIPQVLSEQHGVAHRNALLRAGMSSYGIGRARHAGELIRVRRAWYALPDADREVVRAVRVGGSLSCVSALADTGVWLVKDDRTHVAVPANAARLRSAMSTHAPFAHDPGVVLHWRARPGAIEQPVDPIPVALAHLAVCQSPELALVAIDSALNLRLTGRSQLEEAFSSLPLVYRRLLDQADPSSQSGLETLARFRLRRWGIRLRTQVAIEGVGRVDVLVGDRLVLELDGFGFHATGDAFERDRHRDLALHERGYRVVRLSYRQVMSGWPEAERVVRQMIRRGDHYWPRRRTIPNSG